MSNIKNQEDYVIKRNGQKEAVSFDKILKRVKTLGGDELNVNYTALCTKIIERLYENITTAEIDECLAQQCASLSTTHPDYGVLASRILISNHQKNTSENYLEIIEQLYNFKDINGDSAALVSKKLFDIVNNNKDLIQSWLKYERDFFLDYFGFKTLERAYLMKINGKILERPQHMWMRVSIGIHGTDFENVKKTYDLMSQKYFTHATPTLFNAGTPRPQLSSCYLLAMEDDSIKGIYNTLSDCASISKWAGGIGLHIHNIRASGSHIRGTNGTSNGIVPMLRVFNNTARYVDQGGGKRAGSFAMYLEPWHGDIFEFLEMKKNHGDEEARARDLFYALWIPDLFMKRIKSNGTWTLMCPDVCQGLSDTYGDEFEELYTKYEREGKGIKTVKARQLWFKILDSQIETGVPYLLYKDACNQKSNQKNLGTIKSSNLCTEIIEYSDGNETAVCNLASIGLSKFINYPTHALSNIKIYTKDNCGWCLLVKSLLKSREIHYTETKIEESDFEEFKKTHNYPTLPLIYSNNNKIGGYDNLFKLLKPTFDYDKLHEITKVVTYNLNKVIDVNFYPTKKTRNSNLKHRPIGIGVQGLADAFALLDIAFHSEEAQQINKNIFETIYHAALECSMEISKERSIGMKELKKLWNDKHFQFFEEYYHTELHTKLRTENHKYYHVQNDDVHKLLDKYKPLHNEFVLKSMDNLSGSYSSFKGSPASKGILQFDMWNVSPSDRYDWNKLKNDIQNHGLRNSLLLAPMPTASTSQILGNNECFEPFTSNIYLRRTIAGEFVIINKHLLKELINMNLWNETTKNTIIRDTGSIQNVPNVPKKTKEKYKIVWEIPMKHIINLAADRAAFICQSQSMNLWMKDPTYDKLTSMHFYSWQKGLKTGMYYLRTKAKAAPQQFTVEPEKNPNLEDDDEDCLMCGS
tara:strand:+ start:13736 stop:16501 length:2766 start_codon:yes stop_codon:yes gene_type:complete